MPIGGELTLAIAPPIIFAMKPIELKHVWKTQEGIASALGCKQASVAGWFAAGEVPEGRQYQVQIATLGELKADKPALRNTERAA